MRSLHMRNIALRLSWLIGCVAVSMWSVSAADHPPVRFAQVNAAQNDGSVNLLMKGMSDKDKARFTDEALEEMRGSVSSLQKNVEEARKEKDIMLLNCLNEKLSSINSLLKVTETAAVLLQEALSQNNSQQADHQFRKVVIARFKVKQVVQESNECVGDDGTEGSGNDDVASVNVDSALEGEQTTTDEIVNPIDDYSPTDLPPASS